MRRLGWFWGKIYRLRAGNFGAQFSPHISDSSLIDTQCEMLRKCALLAASLIALPPPLRGVEGAPVGQDLDVNDAPPSWIPAIQNADMLWTPSDASVSANNMPMIGNGEFSGSSCCVGPWG